MQLLYRINRTGTTLLVVTHDREMVDKMRRRVLALDEGRLVRDQVTATYHEESTSEFGVRVRAEMGVARGPHERRGCGEPAAEELTVGRIFFFIAEAFRALRRSASPSLAAIVTVVMTTLLLGVFIPVIKASSTTTQNVQSQLALYVYMFPDATTQAGEGGPEGDQQDPPRRAHGLRLEAGGAQAASREVGKGAIGQGITQLHGKNPLPLSVVVHPDNADNLARSRTRSSRRVRTASPSRSARRSRRSTTARRPQTRSARSRTR